MAIALHSFKIDNDGRVRVQHTFYADSEDEAQEMLEQHAEICPKFGPAFAAKDTVEIYEEIDCLPTPDTVDEFVAGDFDEDDEEEEE